MPPNAVALLGLALLGCSSTAGSTCFADSNGLAGGDYTFDLTVDDAGFSKRILETENLAQVTLELTNTGTKPHGFEVACKATSAPAGCPQTSCFPAGSAIAPLAPGASKTVAFDTPSPEGIYTFRSSEPGDGAVEALNDGQFILM